MTPERLAEIADLQKAAHDIANADGLDAGENYLFEAWRVAVPELLQHYRALQAQLAEAREQIAKNAAIAAWHHERAEFAEADRERMRTALGVARATFARYQDIHMAKVPPDLLKAEANAELAKQMAEALASPVSPAATDRDARQAEVASWVAMCFGDWALRDLEERGLRLAEESIEMAQALGVPEPAVHRVVSSVYRKPVGDPTQEAGGIGITLLATCAALGIAADDCERRELERISRPEVIARCRQKQAAKAEDGTATRGPAATESIDEAGDMALAREAEANASFQKYEEGARDDDKGRLAVTSEALLPNLAPCPFCGGEMQFRKALWPSDGCTDAIIHKGASECGLVAFDTGAIDESVIARWNTRPPLPAAAHARIRAEAAAEAFGEAANYLRGPLLEHIDDIEELLGAAIVTFEKLAAEEAKAAEEPRT